LTAGAGLFNEAARLPCKEALEKNASQRLYG